VSLGHLIAGGLRFEVTSVRLRDGRIVIETARRGPVESMSGVPVTLFGADGQGIFQGGELVIPGAPEGSQCIVRAGVRIETIRPED